MAAPRALDGENWCKVLQTPSLHQEQASVLGYHVNKDTDDTRTQVSLGSQHGAHSGDF